eukprot:scaffold35011_cov57-Phaeocystis_antarctica.AAC.5
MTTAAPPAISSSLDVSAGAGEGGLGVGASELLALGPGSTRSLPLAWRLLSAIPFPTSLDFAQPSFPAFRNFFTSATSLSSSSRTGM